MSSPLIALLNDERTILQTLTNPRKVLEELTNQRLVFTWGWTALWSWWSLLLKSELIEIIFLNALWELQSNPGKLNSFTLSRFWWLVFNRKYCWYSLRRKKKIPVIASRPRIVFMLNCWFKTFSLRSIFLQFNLRSVPSFFKADIVSSHCIICVRSLYVCNHTPIC